MTTSTDRRRGVNSSAAIKVACIAGTTGNITLSGEQTIDGIALVTDDRCLVKNQTTASENGIYRVDTSSWKRAADWDGSYDVTEGTIVPVSRGTSNSDTMWRVSTTGTITVGTTSVTFEAAGVNDSGTVSYLPAGSGAVETTVQAKLRESVSVKDFGAVGDGVTDDTAAIQAAFDYANANNLKVLLSGFHSLTSPITIYTFTNIQGTGADNSGFIHNGTATTYILNIDGDVGQRIRLSDFSIKGGGGNTQYLADMTGLRYSNINNVDFKECKIGMLLTSSWGNTFDNCSWKCGGDSDTRPSGSIGIDAPQSLPASVANATNLNGCVISFNETGLKGTALGRDFVVSGCTIESNTIGALFSGLGMTRGVLFEANYFEANIDHHIKIDRGAGARDDHITVRGNYVDVAAGQISGFIGVYGAVPSGTSSLIVEDNLIEQQLVGSVPTNNYVVYFDAISTNLNFTYKSGIFRVNLAAATQIDHFNHANIDFRSFSSDIPIPLTYSGSFTYREASEALRVYIDNGRAHVIGVAWDSTNASATLQTVATIPTTMISDATGTPVPITGWQAASASALNIKQTVQANGSNLNVNFTEGVLTDYVYIDGSWIIDGGPYK